MALYSFNKKILFVHIPKNAGTSISKLLYNDFNFKHVGGKHDHAEQLPEINSITSFCVVRNPFDRLASHYHYHYKVFELKMQRRKRRKHREHNLKCWNFLNKGFEHYVKSEGFESLFHNESPKWFDTRFEPQSSWANTCNIVLKYESLQQDFDQIKNLLGKDVVLPKSNVSANQNYRQMYDKNLIAYCSEKFQQDLNDFDYGF